MDLISELGGPAVVARWTGCKSPSVIEWRKRGIPSKWGPSIERGSEGRWACEVVCPDARWVRVPDPEWPWHPDGRPLLDVVVSSDGQAAQAEGVRDAA